MFNIFNVKHDLNTYTMQNIILRYLLLAFTFLVIQDNIAQKEANIWHFGNYAGIDFNTGNPVAINGPHSSLCSSATVSDTSGNFLFSTNGIKIFNRQMMLMQNGDNIHGNRHASQGSLIVQKPKSYNLYYVFTTNDGDGPKGLYYSVVDMNLNGGLGAVTSEKNVLLTDAWDALDKIVGVKHENITRQTKPCNSLLL